MRCTRSSPFSTVQMCMEPAYAPRRSLSRRRGDHRPGGGLQAGGGRLAVACGESPTESTGCKQPVLRCRTLERLSIAPRTPRACRGAWATPLGLKSRFRTGTQGGATRLRRFAYPGLCSGTLSADCEAQPFETRRPGPENTVVSRSVSVLQRLSRFARVAPTRELLGASSVNGGSLGRAQK
jgi:hypothetical protein